MNKQLLERIWKKGLTGLSDSKTRFFLVEVLKIQAMTIDQLAEISGDHPLKIQFEIKELLAKDYIAELDGHYYVPPPPGWSRAKIIDNCANIYVLIELYKTDLIGHYQTHLSHVNQQTSSNIVHLHNCA